GHGSRQRTQWITESIDLLGQKVLQIDFDVAGQKLGLLRRLKAVETHGDIERALSLAEELAFPLRGLDGWFLLGDHDVRHEKKCQNQSGSKRCPHANTQEGLSPYDLCRIIFSHAS